MKSSLTLSGLQSTAKSMTFSDSYDNKTKRREQYRQKIRNCPLRKKLRELSKIHDYYMFLFEVCRLKGVCRDRKKRKIKPFHGNRVVNRLDKIRICIADYPCNQQVAISHNRLWECERIIPEKNALVGLFYQKGV
jgi:hypothetical protein